MRLFWIMIIGALSGFITGACGYSYFNPETMVTAIIINGTVIFVSSIVLFLIFD